MIRVAALTQGRFSPSSRFRVRQNISKLRELYVDVTEYCSAIDASQGVPLNIEQLPRHIRFPIVAGWQGLKVISRISDIYRTRRHHVTWLQRELLPGYLTLERMLATPLVFDVDDAIWLTKGNAKNVYRIASVANVVIAGNQYIADWVSSVNNDVAIIPTAVDVERFVPIKNTIRHHFTVGWIGTSGNLHYLEEVVPALIAFFERYDDCELLVVSDRPPRLPAVPESRIRYLPWSESIEVEAIQGMDVGIMPLPDNEWSMGKCSYKMLQYMACGIPVVVSPIGMNVEVLSKGNVGFGASSQEDWFSGLDFLYNNRIVGREMGLCGRNVITNNYSIAVVSEKIAMLFKSLVK